MPSVCQSAFRDCHLMTLHSVSVSISISILAKLIPHPLSSTGVPVGKYAFETGNFARWPFNRMFIEALSCTNPISFIYWFEAEYLSCFISFCTWMTFGLLLGITANAFCSVYCISGDALQWAVWKGQIYISEFNVWRVNKANQLWVPTARSVWERRNCEDFLS